MASVRPSKHGLKKSCALALLLALSGGISCGATAADAPTSAPTSAPATAPATEQAPTAGDQDLKLIELGRFAISWSADHNNRLPNSLGQILMMGFSPTLVRSALNETPPPPAPVMMPSNAASIEKWVAANSDYIWAGTGMSNDSDTLRILAYRRPLPNDRGQVSVLFGDCHVEVLKRSLFEKLLKDENVWRKAHHLPELTPTGVKWPAS